MLKTAVVNLSDAPAPAVDYRREAEKLKQEIDRLSEDNSHLERTAKGFKKTITDLTEQLERQGSSERWLRT